MLEYFAESARKVLSLARQEALRLNSEFLGTEHILLGILQEGGGVAARVLKNLNIDLERIRQELRQPSTPSPTPSLGQLPFTPRARRVLELAFEAHEVLRHGAVDTGHVLLGLLKENEGAACRILVGLGLKPEQVRDRVLEVLESGEAGGASA